MQGVGLHADNGADSHHLFLGCPGMWGVATTCSDDTCFVGLFLLGFFGGSAIIMVPFFSLSLGMQKREAIKLNHVLERRYPDLFETLGGRGTSRPRNGGARAAAARSSNTAPRRSAPHSLTSSAAPAPPVLVPAPSAPPPDDPRDYRISSRHSSGRAPQRRSDRSSPTPSLRRTSSRDLHRKESTVECIVCMDDERSILFLPCRHVACCTACADALRKCPVCRQRIDERLRIAIS